MDLVLFITNSQNGQLRKCFSARGGTIGRGAHSDWVLPDPQSFISNQHAMIRYENGNYFLIDTSTNGVYLNSDGEAIGKNRSLQLSHGDRIYIGEYEISVELESEQPAAASQGEHDPFTGGIPNTLDPLDFYASHAQSDKSSNEIKSQKVLARGSMDQTPSLDEYFAPPKIKMENQIPDNWALTHLPDIPSQKNNKKQPALNTASDQIPNDWSVTNIEGHNAETSTLENFTEAQDVYRSGSVKTNDYMPPDQMHENAFERRASLADAHVPASQPMPDEEYEAVLKALGINKEAVSSELLEALPKVIGLVARESILGLMSTLQSRANMKSAFRVEQTSLQPERNNPLKFAVNIDDALENMFMKNDRAYLFAIEAITDGFKDINAHQMATLAGMQGALQDLLYRFSPDALENQFNEIPSGKALFPRNNSAKYWGQYKKFHDKVNRDIVDNFQHFLGEEFTTAYEKQAGRVESAEYDSKKQGDK